MTEVLIDGLILRGNGVHEEYLGALARGYREPFTAELFARSVREGATVVDAGAFIGFYTLLAAHRVGQDGIVVAFEPDPEAFELLCLNVRENGFKHQVIALPFGLGNATSTDRTTLDDALGARPIDVVRLDVDGREVEVLRGMRRTLAASPDPSLFVRCSPDALSRAGTSQRTLFRELEGAGLELALIDDQNWELRPADDEPLASGVDGRLNLSCRRG